MEIKDLKLIPPSKRATAFFRNFMREHDKGLKAIKTLAEIKEIINEFAKEDILTFPDFSKEKNYELIQKQCGEPILKILQKIKEVTDEKTTNRN